ncbi:hypothetical protein RhiirA4_475828 [Rhizophagus irregularis]|uniref:Uncharacterized protein n=1 Tax=Rhizophagus irregularis TaxID=588596 RepID=A0A2I1HAN2_9GLOM|nr:hypothetical protein RhiirA4_475828 [Rhizophagus irregularis]
MEQHVELTNHLTESQGSHHRKMTSLSKRHAASTDPALKAKLEKEYNNFKIEYFPSTNYNTMTHCYRGDTSDDTKALEAHPRKRNVESNYNFNLHRLTHQDVNF